MSQKKADKLAYTKAQFLASGQFGPVHKDVLRVVLKDDQTYTLDQAQKLVDQFAKRTVE